MRLCLIFLLLPGAICAQMVDAGGKRIDVFMVDEAPVLDGVLDDDAWAFATPITDLHQIEPDKIGAQIMTQGDWSWGEDTIKVFIDPLGQRRSGYLFDLTPNGVRNQGVFENVTTVNWNWRGIWHGEARITDDGWVAELEIPFKTLSFDPKNDTWGLNVGRYIGRKGEQIESIELAKAELLN